MESDDFRIRESADASLLDWSKEHGDKGLHELLRLSREHESAEVRVRTFGVLRIAVAAIHEADGQGYMGIMMKDLSAVVPDKGEDKPMPVVLITHVMADTGAGKAGLKAGDMIFELNGKDWRGLPPDRRASDDMRTKIQKLKPGTEIRLHVLRGKQTEEFALVLGRKPANVDMMLLGEAPEELQERIRKMEDEEREKHFKKWLLQQKNDR